MDDRSGNNTTMRCEEALKLLALYLDDELEAGVRDEVRDHLETCRSCWSRAEFERRLKAQLAELGRAPVGRALEGRIRKLIRRFAAGA